MSGDYAVQEVETAFLSQQHEQSDPSDPHSMEDMSAYAEEPRESDPLMEVPSYEKASGPIAPDVPVTMATPVKDKWRNIIGFWILGLCNNYPYVIMLSAAFDILKHFRKECTTAELYSGDINCTNHTSNNNSRDCNPSSTSVILLADIVPTFVIKLVFPYFMNFIPYWIRVFSVVGFSLLSFILVGLQLNKVVVIFGVVCASISSGFGEITFLSLTALYDKSTVSAWSSGTGAAGVAGAAVYLLLRIGLSDQVTLFIQVFMPLVMIVSYFLLLGKAGKAPPPREEAGSEGEEEDDETKALISSESESGGGGGGGERKTWAERWREVRFFKKEEKEAWRSHVAYIPRLVKYMVPLFLVYVAEYMINQGLFELLYQGDTHLGKLTIGHGEQYRILQVVYQVGVFISRSSVSLIHFKHFWVLALLQVANFAFLFCESLYWFIPSFWITFVIILYEGLLGGGVYVNAFYAIAKQVPEVHREFSMGLASVADSTGITVAGFVSLFIHNYICGVPAPHGG